MRLHDLRTTVSRFVDDERRFLVRLSGKWVYDMIGFGQAGRRYHLVTRVQKTHEGHRISSVVIKFHSFTTLSLLRTILYSHSIGILSSKIIRCSQKRIPYPSSPESRRRRKKKRIHRSIIVISITINHSPKRLNMQFNPRPTLLSILLNSIPHTIHQPSRPTSSDKNSIVDSAVVRDSANHRMEVRATVSDVWR